MPHNAALAAARTATPTRGGVIQTPAHTVGTAGAHRETRRAHLRVPVSLLL